MKKFLIVANWKSNMSVQESDLWTEQMVNCKWQIDEKEVVVCPPFHLLPLVYQAINSKKLQMKIGAQNVSPFPKGAYTGEVTAEQLKEFVTYAIIGHSERRKYFHEDPQMLANKVDLALENGITPIFCIQDEHTPIPEKVSIAAYEPTFAIGTGEPDTPQSANGVARAVKERTKVAKVLYGGSVTGENVRSFTEMDAIDGVLVGSASLKPESFAHIVQNA